MVAAESSGRRIGATKQNTKHEEDSNEEQEAPKP